MTLIYDALNDCYVWVEVDDENIELSPQFDTEEDAMQWYGRLATIMFEDFGINDEQQKKNPWKKLHGQKTIPKCVRGPNCHLLPKTEN